MLLAIDTATRQLALALHSGTHVLAEQLWFTSDFHSVELAPQVALMLRRANVEPRALRGLAVAIGPGSYTALRIGLAFAKGLALAHNVPLIGVSTFEVLMRAQPLTHGHMLAVLQAGRGRINAVWYAASVTGWQATTPVRTLTWEALSAEVTTPIRLCGDVDAASLEKIGKNKCFLLIPPAENVRRAAQLADLGWERLRHNATDAPRTLAPAYATQPDGA